MQVDQQQAQMYEKRYVEMSWLLGQKDVMTIIQQMEMDVTQIVK